MDSISRQMAECNTKGLRNLYRTHDTSRVS
jgi:hypothetical protein